MNLSLADVALMCEGVLSPNSDKNLLINNVVIDSRKVVGNTLFVALVGNNQDGHSFIHDISPQFQHASLVNKERLLKINRGDIPNLIYVEDPVKALGMLAHNHRQKFNIPLVGITGSNGKTTVKEMLKLICEYHFGAEYVLATEGNLNNHLGMPLTLLKMKDIHKVTILEMGMNHMHELDYLSNLACPTITVVNNVVLAHAGFFNAIEDIAQAKAEIYHGLIAGGIACINTSEPLYSIFEKNIAPHITRYYYGDSKSGCYLKTATLDTCIVIPNGELHINLQVLGEHNKKNALTAVALALNLGCDFSSIVKGLNAYKGFARRLEKKTAFNGALIIDDSYNANPDSVKAAILAIGHLPKPHWLILGDLKELGSFAINVHKEIGRFACNRIDRLLTVGELAQIANTAFSGDKLHFASNSDIVEYCLEHLPMRATLLVKGSLSTNLGKVVDKLIR